MSQAAKGTTGFDLFKTLRERRDQVLAAVARVTLRLTSSRPYFVVTSALSRPTLIASGASRKATTAASLQILAQIHLPSREEVLALAQRLTRIEMVLDDISAAQDAAAVKPRAATARLQQPAAEKPSSHRLAKA